MKPADFDKVADFLYSLDHQDAAPLNKAALKEFLTEQKEEFEKELIVLLVQEYSILLKWEAYPERRSPSDKREVLFHLVPRIKAIFDTSKEALRHHEVYIKSAFYTARISIATSEADGFTKLPEVNPFSLNSLMDTNLLSHMLRDFTTNPFYKDVKLYDADT